MMRMTRLEPDPFNVLIAGVGGQGNIVASKVLALAANRSGLFATVGETYGASQRGGSVMSHVRLSAVGPPGPLIPRGQAHVVVGFEPIETLRRLKEYGGPATRVFLNLRPNYPISVLSGREEYPPLEDVVARIEQLTAGYTVVPGTELAKEAGAAVALNIVMLGVLAGSRLLPVPDEHFVAALKESFTSHRVKVNLEAFRLGKAHIETVA